MKILIFPTDRFSIRNIRMANLENYLKQKGHGVNYFETTAPKCFFEKLIRKIRINLYKIVYFRYAEISKWKKHQFKKEHSSESDFEAHLGWPFPRSRLIYHVLNYIFLNLPSFIKLNEKPDCILVTSCQDGIAQMATKYASQHGIKVYCLVNSWDHLTHGNKAISSACISKYLVWNAIQKDELIHLHDIPEKKIEICGALQFDFFVHTDTTETEKELHRELNIPPGTKVLFLPAYNERHGRFEPMAVKHLLENKNKISHPFKIIIRPYPNKEDFMKRFSEVIGDDDCIISNWKDDVIEDRKLIISLLKLSDVILSGPGTVAIEAMYYDKPVIHLGIEPSESSNMNFLFKKNFFSDHYLHIMNRNASVFVQSFNALFDAINTYLADPYLHHVQRRELIIEQMYYIDGKAHQRVEQIIKETAG